MTSKQMKRLGLEKTKLHCGCAMRAVFIDRQGRCRNKRIHHKDCHYFKPRSWYISCRNYTNGESRVPANR